MADPAAQLPASSGTDASSADLTSELEALQLGGSSGVRAEAAGLAAAPVGTEELPAREATIHDLPEDVLARIFSSLVWNKLPRAAMVCRRWRRVALSSPDCLARVGVKVGGPKGVAYTGSVLAWLKTYAAGRVRSLHLDVVPPPGSAADVAAVAAGVEALLAACAAAGRLTHLHLALAAVLAPARAPWPPLRAGSWLGSLSLPALQSLHLSTDSLLDVPEGPLAGLTALQQCELQGRPLALPPTARLPTSLRSLVLGGLETPPPRQLAELAQLTRLALPRLRSGNSATLAFLPSLDSLLDLELSHCQVPVCLPRLTFLTALTLERVWVDAPAWAAVVEEGEGEGEEPAGPVDAMQTALAPLTALRRLALRTVIGLPFVPPVVTALPSLQHLEWRGLF